MWAKIFLAVIVSSIGIKAEDQEYIGLETKQGDVRGVVLDARNGDKFAAYFGIPFARPPVGEFRWQPPQKGNMIIFLALISNTMVISF